MIIAILGWLISSLVIGIVGSNKKIGFGGAFFLSFLLSPVIGLIITLTSKSISEEKYQEELLEIQKKQQIAMENISQKNISSVADELKKIKELLETGVISQDEFNKIKSRLLDTIDETSIELTQSSRIDNGGVKKNNFDINEKTWVSYSTSEGTLEVEIYKVNKYPNAGDSVRLNGEPVQEGKFRVSLFNVIRVKESKVLR